MELKLHAKDNIRLSTNRDQYIDCTSEKDEIALTVTAASRLLYMEVRKKGYEVRTFYFQCKGHKKYYDFGYWGDAEVVFALNDVNKDF